MFSLPKSFTPLPLNYPVRQYINPLFSPQFYPSPLISPLLTPQFSHPLFYGLNSPYLPNFDYIAAQKALNMTQPQIQEISLQNLYDFKSKLQCTTDSPFSLSSKSKLASPESEPRSAVKSEPEGTLELPADPAICLEAQIKYIVQFFVSKFGTASQREISQMRVKYEGDHRLALVFDALEKKYLATSKTREEMVKWIIRRSMKTTKKSLKGKQNTDKKRILNELCKRYFSEAADDNESGDEIVDSVLPFRKNSKNKTMNTTFVVEIFQSEDFKQDYKVFLEDFDEISEEENQEKMRRFSQAVLECAKKNNFSSIAKYRRIPWLKVWMKKTKEVAVELNEGNFTGRTGKKMKVGHEN